MARRRLIVARGAAADQGLAAQVTRSHAPADAACWLGSRAPPSWPGIATQRADDLLGSTFHVVVVDQRSGWSADALAAAGGAVARGGALVLVRPTRAAELPSERRLEAWCARHGHPGDVPPWEAAGAVHAPEQAALVEALLAVRSGTHAIVARRGRGKTVALARLAEQMPGVTVATEGSGPLLAHWGAVPAGVRVAPLAEAAAAPVLVVDEAARVPVFHLRSTIEGRDGRPTLLATTTDGYEGSGQGFVLRFLDALTRAGRPVRVWTLDRPLRWDLHDPLEEALDDLLLLAPGAPTTPSIEGAPRSLGKERLTSDDPTLRSVCSLLTWAHYRTRPEDLRRLLDGPELDVHVVDGVAGLAGVSVASREGAWTAAQAEAAARHGHRVPRQALADVVATHLGSPEISQRTILRSVRTAVAPGVRRSGVARSLVAHVHASYDADLFGTMFGATPELIRFRRAVGYEVVHFGTHRGPGSGVPSVVMVRTDRPDVQSWIEHQRESLARNLPLQWRVALADGPLDPELLELLTFGLAAPRIPDEATSRRELEGWLGGARPYESAIWAVHRLVTEHADALGRFPEADRRRVMIRVVHGSSWPSTAAAVGDPSVSACIRRLRSTLTILAGGPRMPLPGPRDSQRREVR